MSVRKRTMVTATTSNAIGCSLDNTNICTTTAWRRGHQSRREVAASIRETFDPSGLWMLHWDGKTCKLSMEQKSNFVAIYVASVDGRKVKKLLDIPMVSSSKAEDEFRVLKDALGTWRIKKEDIIGMVFDTTSSNTGEWSGVCR